jgi:hypothetical protein
MGASASHGGEVGFSTDVPPPTYEEAMFLVGDEKRQSSHGGIKVCSKVSAMDI